ncbi:hypothetical protein SAMN04489761_2939 [Tenacibaculum sp. MAR_2009_124]|uniref:hypothetical protein n=1 Tax=Tenacibaculum sp. MAR_2009_124 TaxID=1250059 RepID=UPI00089B4C22|nr:hypothetical protein [Tenacibaculum sp. MAR_2009_124]SEC41862.1 hypothetical protein SAMN04489761_2939 [Tenacibaculum sp. MAR_2009_124]
MKRSDEYLENRIRWRVRKNNVLCSKVSFFEDLDKLKQQKLIALLTPQNIGNPVVYFKGRKRNWTIIGTQKIACGNDTFADSIAYENINQWTPYDYPLDEPKTTIEYLKARYFGYIKRLQYKILMEEKGGRRVIFYGPRGWKLYDILNITLMMERFKKNYE